MDEASARTVLRELRVLRRLAGAPHVVQLIDVVVPRGAGAVALVFERRGMDMVVASQHRMFATPELARECAWQLLTGLRAMHKRGVVHRDLTPRNVLVDDRAGDGTFALEICDLGCAATADANLVNDYVVTRWYRAPELCGAFFPLQHADMQAVDVWAAACIIAEAAAGGRVLFPGRDARQQLKLALAVTGMPGPGQLCRAKPGALHNLFTFRTTSPGAPAPEALPVALKAAMGEAGVDLLMGMLRLDPRDRPSVDDTLAHPYFRGRPLPPLSATGGSAGRRVSFAFEHMEPSIELMRILTEREDAANANASANQAGGAGGRRRTRSADDDYRQLKHILPGLVEGA